MKTKIANALKTKYANLGLSEKALNGVASILEKTVTEESGIESAIAEASVADLLKVFQGELDRERGAKTVAERALADYKKEHEGGVNHGLDDETKNQLATLMQEHKALKEQLAASEKANRDKEVISKVHELMKASGCTNDFIRNMTLKGIVVKDDDTAENIAESYKEAYNTNFKEAYGEGMVPPRGTPNPEGYKKGDYKAIADKLKRNGDIPSNE